jgi:spermidine/putrescine-binding protein
MMKKLFAAFLGFALILSLTVLPGCGGGAKSVLNLYCWTEYIPDSVIADFEKETGIKVNVVNYSNNEDMLNRVRTDSPGTFDICQPSDYMVEYMIAQGLLEPMDTAKLENLGNIGAQYMNQSFDPGNQYSVPYMTGTATLAVNTDKITDPITSYNDLFNEKYAGKIAVLDDFRAVIGFAAKSLGYTMSETDDAKLAEIRAQLLRLKPLIKTYDSDNPKELLITGNVSIAFCWSAEIALAMAENPAIVVVYPEEGAYLFLDNFVIPKGAKNVDNAMRFIDYILRPEVSARMCEEYPYVNPNVEAVKLLSEAYRNNQASNPAANVFSGGEYIRDVGAKISVYDKMWTDLKG